MASGAFRGPVRPASIKEPLKLYRDTNPLSKRVDVIDHDYFLCATNITSDRHP